MALILEMTIFWREHDGRDASGKHEAPLHDVVIIPQSQDPAILKQQIGAELHNIKESGIVAPGDSYWYVVLKVRKLSGGIGYRTQIPKTFF